MIYIWDLCYRDSKISLPQQQNNEEPFLQIKHFLIRSFREEIQLIKNLSGLFRVVSVGQFWLDKVEKSGNAVKTVRLEFSELKMYAVLRRI